VRIDQIISGEAIDRLGDVLLLVGLDGSILDANPAALDCYGYSRAEMLGLSIHDIRAPQDHGAIDDQMREAAESGVLFETEDRRSDGTLFPAEVRAASISVGGEIALLGIVRDITERRQAEEELRESEERYRSILDASPDGIAITDLEGRVLMVSPSALRMFGYDSEVGLLGRSVDDFTIPEDRGRAASNTALMSQGILPGPTEYRGMRADGSAVAVEVNSEFIRDADGQPIDRVLIIRDITERKTAQQEQSRAERFFQDTFEHADVGIAHVNSTDGTWLRVNQRLCDLLGYTREELMHTTFSAITHPDDVEENMRHHRRLLAGDEETYAADKRYLRKDGSIVWVHMNVVLIRKEDGTPDYNITVLTDISAEKKSEELAARQAERIERTLTSVIDIAGSIGELRDPYTAGHQKRVAELAARIARELGMSDLEVADIDVAALLHDIGKAAVPTELLGKPGLISPVELDLIKGHAEAGYRIAVSANMEEPIPELIYQHHERCDGSGYPRGLRGDEILPGAKVLAVADVVEAMTSHRPYRAALGIEAALAEIEMGAGSLYDAEVSRVCIALFREGRFGFSV
jgi:PAS domain S-box-containing protein/putative nucleotidyltransferase with HDIG domain